jgi:hypothetical protein
MTNVLITGAAGNLGSLLSRHIRDHEKDLNLILMQHLKTIPGDIKGFPRFQVRSADLSDQNTLYECLDGVDIIVHFAGVLFKANPEKFLYETNIQYFENLVGVAKARGLGGGLGTFLGFTVFQGILVGPNAVNLSPLNLMWMPLASFRRRPGSSLFNMLAGVGPRQGIDIVKEWGQA